MSFKHFIGVDLGGGKGKTTAIAHVHAVDDPGVVKVRVAHYGTGREAPFFDDRLLDELRRHPDALVAIDAPLSLPACVRCTLPTCPGQASCDVPVIEWFKARDREHSDAVVSLVPKKPRYTSYTQRATEVILGDDHEILPRETLGQGMGPLTARASYLVKALRPAFELGRNLIEVYPKATLYQLLGRRAVEKYKHSADSRDVRMKILEALPELSFGLGAWKEFALDNDHKFDAIICAYTAYLYSRGACMPPPDDVVASDGWIWVPQKVS